MSGAGLETADEAKLAELAAAGHGEAAFLLGHRLMTAGDFERAEPWLQQAADMGHAQAIQNLAWIYWNTGRTAEALCAIIDAIEYGSAGARLVLVAFFGLSSEGAFAPEMRRKMLEHLHLAAESDPSLRTDLKDVYDKLDADPLMAEIVAEARNKKPSRLH